jgi:phage-related minor tail protein
MAGITDIIVKIGADISGLSKGFSDAGKQTGDFESKIKGIGGSMTAAGGAMTAGVTAPLMAIGAFAMKSASDVGGAFKTIEKATGATGPQLVSLKGTFKDVFGSMPISAGDAATAIGKISPILTTLNNGIAPTRESMTQVTTAFEEFAKVTGTDITADVTTLGKAFTAFGVSGDEIPGMLGEVNVAAQKTGDSTDTLMASVLSAAPVFNTMGFSMTETTALMAKLDMSGAKGKATISALSKVMQEAGEAGKSPKLVFSQLSEELKNGTHTSAEATKLYKELGAKGFANLSTAARSGALDIGTLTKAMKEGSGGLDAQYKKTLTFGDNLKILTNKLEVAFQPLGTAIFNTLGMIVDAAKPIIDIVTKIAEAFGNLPAPIQMVVVIVGMIAAAIGPVLMAVGMALPAITTAIGAITGLFAEGGILAGIGGFIGELGLAGVMLNPITIAVAALVGLFVLLYTQSATFRDVIGQAVAKVQELFGFIMKLGGLLLGGKWGEAGEMLKKGFTDAVNMIKNINWGGVRDTILKIFSEVGTSIMNFLKPVGNMIGGLFDGIKKVDWGGILAGALDAFANLLDQVMGMDWGGIVTGLIDSLVGAFGGGGGGDDKKKADDAAKKTGDAAKQFDMGKTLSTSVEKAAPDILGKLGNVFVKLVATLPVIFLKITTALAAALMKVNWGEIANKLWEAIKTALGVIVTWLVSQPWAQWAMTVWNALTGAVGKIIVWLQSLPWIQYATTVWNALKTVIGTIVTWLQSLPWASYAATVWNALKGAIGAIVGWLISLPWASYAATVWNALKGAIGAIIGWLIGLDWGGVARTFYNAITGAVGGIIGWLRGLDWGGVARTLYNAIIGALGGLLGWFLSINWGQVGTALWNAIQSIDIPGKLSSALSTIGDGIVNALKSFWNDHIAGHYGIGPLGFDIARVASGGLINAQRGGMLAVLGEGGEREWVVPARYEWGIDPAVRSALSTHQFATGGVISGAYSSSMSFPRSSARSGGTTAGATYQYNAYITVDSENIKREVFKGFRELEDYAHLGRF